MTKTYLLRTVLSLLFLVAVLGVFVWRLYDLQIVNGESYAQRDEQLFTATVRIKSTRGEIRDRYGKPLAVNRQGYALAFDMAHLPDDRINEIILTAVRLLEKSGESWNDYLPISRTEPFVFLEQQETYVQSLLTRYRLNDWATAANVLDAMADAYRVKDFTPAETRIIVSVRYAMDLAGFNVRNPYTVSTGISEQTVMLFEENSFQLPGVKVVEVPIRTYVCGSTAAHIVGTVSPIYASEYQELSEKGYAMDDYIGRSGLEAACEDYLRGEDGEKVITFNRAGEVVSEEITKQPVPGGVVYTTIDSELQSFVQLALARRIQEISDAGIVAGDNAPGHDACAGAICIEDVNTGEMLAVATCPGYDLSTYNQDYSMLVQDENRPLWNRALYGTYAPGSTFKPATSLAALAEGIVKPSTTEFCGGIYTFFQDYQPTCMGVHQHTNLRRALCYSCNVYYYEVGRLLGIDAIKSYANELGLGVKTGIEPEIGEATGIIANPEYKAQLLMTWNPGDVIQAAIGQSDTLVTPIQLCSYASTLANRGIRYRTRLVRNVKSFDMQQELYRPQPEVLADLTQYDQHFDAIEEGMVASTTEGTLASWFRDYRVEIAAKTGTPQPGQAERSNNASFIAYAPTENPQIAVSIVIERGGHGYYIAPLMKDVLDYYFDTHDLSYEHGNTLLR